MRNAFCLLFGLVLATAAIAQRDIGIVDVKGDANVMGITVTSSSAELQNLAMQAFNAHGRYKLYASGASYSINFAPAGATSVTVTIARGGSTTHTQTVSGTSLRNALLRAADVAVTKTSGLRGWFAGKLAFVGERTGKTEIYTSDLFFGELVKWSSDGKQVIGPRWSPDGSKIVYTSYRTSFPDIYQIEFASRRISLLASFKGTNSGGRFSPDGSRLAMVLSGEGNPEVYVGNASARQLKRLTNNQSVEASPTFSPDGGRILYVSDAAGGPQLYTIPVGGGSATRLATNISKYCAEPDWSAADPSKIVFTAGVGRGYQSAVFDTKSGTSKIITKAPTDAIEPVWLADGRHIICTYRAANTKVLYIVDTESGKATRLSPAAFGNAGNASYLAP
ncbi:biopolymer transporter Tol [Oleiharenicola lentus]|jgi:TolB protein|uniref:Biopolymer transporter Tol n=1 Tax=Oleiharenicola lentus TaxID=2508720 RepID=A0A4V1M6U5_9BACT|nr:PD40 domain-containing protein [Oleiharenicola lentus]RXK56619.1 biopolymer transporter Tol [Oleiharenicola lentus]